MTDKDFGALPASPSVPTEREADRWSSLEALAKAAAGLISG